MRPRRRSAILLATTHSVIASPFGGLLYCGARQNLHKNYFARFSLPLLFHRLAQSSTGRTRLFNLYDKNLCKQIFLSLFYFFAPPFCSQQRTALLLRLSGEIKIFGKGYSTIRRTFLQVKSVCFKKTCVGRRKRNNNPIFNGRISCSLLLHLSLRSQINRPRAPCHNKTPTSYNLSVDFFDLSYRAMQVNYIVTDSFGFCNPLI